MLAVLSAVIGILLAYYGVISKKPRVFFKMSPIFKDNLVYLNLHISNCGDKPAFNVKIKLNGKISNFINSHTKNEVLEKEANIAKKEEELLSIDDPLISFKKLDISMLKNELDNYIIMERSTRECLSNCFNNTIKFLSGSENEIVFLGIVTDKKGGLKKEFEVNATISFYEELKLTIFTKNVLKLIIYLFEGILEICELLLCIIFNFFNFFDIYTIVYHYCQKIIDKVNNNFFNLFKIDLDNDRILIYHSYEESVTNSELYPYKVVDNSLEDKLDIMCDYVKIKKKNLFFNDILYTTWESKLTKDELSIMRQYRLLYGNNYHQYIKLFERLYEINCDKEIENKEQFKKKYVALILAMHNSNLLSETEKNDIKRIHLKHDVMRINKGEKNERKKRRK